MGWSKELKANKPISVSDVQDAINTLPKHLIGRNYKGVTHWGLATDIGKPEGLVLDISGAHYSEIYASSMARYMAKQLRKMGYNIKVGRTT